MLCGILYDICETCAMDNTLLLLDSWTPIDRYGTRVVALGCKAHAPDKEVFGKLPDLFATFAGDVV